MGRKVVVVTGASRGFGLLIAMELARRGHRVFAGMRKPAASPAFDADGREAQLQIEKVVLDVTDPKSVARATAEIEAKGGHIDVLVNNAGLNRAGFFEDLTPEEFDLVMDTNFKGAVAMMRAVLPGMRTRRSGHIINISSIYGFMGGPMSSAYSASKWALEGFTESLRAEVRPLGIQLSLIEPGFFATDLLEPTHFASNRLGDPASPYYPAVLASNEFFAKRIAPHVGDPKLVARLVSDVAEGDKAVLRRVIGKHGRLLRTLRALLPSSTFEWFNGRVIAKALKAHGRKRVEIEA
jgi:NAD(P)-dependent dehydrogenase (short-subunit alcohol dehydrogenase family)